ncbi:S41 family peptidase [Alkalibacterium putridalgicola]|uniref:Carboxy-terminal processing protease CtpA n=1 Tax=Alkalibacterium putridalgicola TaxID=426703 RepID=A0A1H7V6P4_9LACT|nr:S41 family peptidase [Alkalibacterium putridalgicola]GEK89764.1 carboxy-terminal processing protease CtpA [Alkalibacterium putridalgicola]SEM04578.1 carboxyl-terminal processing protease [Alkalibacterium putridalgicola]
MQHEPENKETKKVSLTVYIASLLIVLLVAVLGTVLALNVTGDSDDQADLQNETEEADSLLGTESEDLADEVDFEPLREVYSILMTQYLEEVDSDTLIEGALQGMAEAVEDPYTTYLDEVEATSMNEDIEGSFEGIGAEVMKEGEYVRIISPISGSPAEEAGLLPNDLIDEVNGESVAELSINEAVALIRGPQGTEVELSIIRGDNEFTVNIIRDSIPLESVVYEIDADNPTIGYVHITNFNRPTYEELVDAIEALQAEGAEEFIFDVRGNPGGLLDSALQLSNIFVENGEPLMQSQGRGEEPYVYTASDELGEFKLDQESVLLINGGSASASEILAGAMSQSADIPLIGTTTFGKGTIQNVLDITGDGEIKFTAGKWLTADGTWINEEGIAPDMEVEMPDYINLMLVNSEETYETGDVSEEVYNLEQILDVLDYDVGSVDFTYDEETVEAVESFQAENELDQDGIVTGDTARTLVERLRELIEANDAQYDAAVDYLLEN